TIEIIKKYGKIPLVGCYPGQINQVFMNLLANALDALEEQNEKCSYEEILANPSKIWIYTEVIRKNWITIRITDNGLGMSEAVRSKLFDPFFTTKPVGKGTGLGLSISYQIVTIKHNGRLYCNSEVGQGAEFVVEIPINQN
nr:HAMP domain-containing histidine kinase [Nostocaceae cyanobacterium]